MTGFVQVAEDQPIERPPAALAPTVAPVWPGSEHQGPRPDHKITSDPGDASPIGHRAEPFVPTDEMPVPGSFGVAPNA